ncbi:hypothetical protein J3998_07100 [Thiomicrorhabdus sp. 6S2-11]|uniref:Uncharacterized protein n=1 Tax=Thiomicrorhabdus marina TaxID=2818442 RepID=A0ABS3Q4U8_9GAMM|nr:hypothetical protein [Thiomicrorhabdus marina]MBO1927343.1 hypothetical protein [Thiomicrorhabdus marina]
MLQKLRLTIGLSSLITASSAVFAGNIEQPLSLPTTDAAFKLSFETVTLPDNEKMGFLGGQFLYELTPWLSVGPAAYGALTGERGGFITLGAAVDSELSLTDKLSFNMGYFVGAGGGRGGYTLSGGGLMLRAHAGANYHLDGWGKLGVGISNVNFPNGHIDSTQPYLTYSYPFTTLHSSGWRGDSFSGYTGKSAKASIQEFSVVMRRYKIPSGVTTDSGLPQHPTVDLIGAEWSNYLNDNYFVKVESEGAMGGRSQGYMQIFLGGGYRYSLTPGTALKLSASAGVAGGGAMDTGGGLLLDSQISLQQRLGGQLFAEVGAGYVQAPQASFEATSLVAKLGYQFGTPRVSGSKVPMGSLTGYHNNHFRFRLAHQQYMKADPAWRAHHADLNIDNLGVQIDYFPYDNLYLSGQGIAAYDGEAGAYMAGLVGAGLHAELIGSLYAEAEVLVGAAGGGGVDVGGGFVWQTNANLGYELNDHLSLTVGAGRMEAPNGNFKANVMALGLSYKFDLFMKD